MKKSLRSSKTLSRSIITPFKSLENRQDTTHSENMYSSLCDDTVRRLQVEMDMLRRQFLLEREHRTTDIVGIHQKVAELSKENIQRFDSLRDIFTQIQSNIDERLIKREEKIEQMDNNRMSVQSNIDFLFKKTWELDTSIADILTRQDSSESQGSFQLLETATFDMKQQLDEIKQYLERLDVSVKPTDQNVNTRLQGIEEELKELVYRYQPLMKNNQAYKIQDELSGIHKIIKEHEDLIHSLAFKDESGLENIYTYIDEQWQKKIETKLSKIVNSYNINFQQLQQTNLQIKDILEEVINVNGNLSQKLLTVINGKLDISVFKESISSLSNQFTQTLTLNYEKINQIRDKEYEVEHELRSLKDILDKHDFDRNNSGGRSVQKEMDQISNSIRDIDEPFIVSPRNARRKLKIGNTFRSRSNLSELEIQINE